MTAVAAPPLPPSSDRSAPEGDAHEQAPVAVVASASVADHPRHAIAAHRAPFASTPFARVLSSKPCRAVLCFVAIAAIPYAHPRLARLRLWTAPWEKHVDATAAVDPSGPRGIDPVYGEVTLRGGVDETPPMVDPMVDPVVEQGVDEQGAGHGDRAAKTATSAAAPSAAPIPLSDLAVAAGAVGKQVEDPSGHALDAFFVALAKTERGEPGATTRIAHYGDSLLVSDFMSSTLRRRFQGRFGDGGHGWVLVAKPWAWYFHQDVSFWSSDGWRTSRIVNPRIPDELYGYGGATFRTSEGGIRASFSTAKPEPGEPTSEKTAFGRRVSRFDVHYLEQPDGGAFDLLLDGKVVSTVATRGPAKALKIATVHADDGPHTLDIKTTGSGEARLFGVAMERDVPGVVWDAIGINGARARLLDVIDHENWAQSLRARAPSLVVLQYGTNESEDTGYPTEQYESTLAGVLGEVRTALPDASCLVVGTMDRAGYGAGGMETRPIIPKLSASQRKVAFAAGCAFWDTYAAMGGSGAMGRWSQVKPRLAGGDLTHPTSQGAALLGDLLYTALTLAYDTRAR